MLLEIINSKGKEWVIRFSQQGTKECALFF
jgi:hypothetical protein